MTTIAKMIIVNELANLVYQIKKLFSCGKGRRTKEVIV